MHDRLGNKGFSLIELIVVIAIMGVLIGGSINMIAYIQLGNVKKCANMINTHIGEVRADALSQADIPYLIVYSTGSEIYSYKTNLATTAEQNQLLDGSVGQKLTNQNITIKFLKEGETSPYTLADATSIRAGDLLDPANSAHTKVIAIKFKKSTGAFSDSVPFYPELQISSDHRTYKLNMIKETGRYYIE